MPNLNVVFSLFSLIGTGSQSTALASRLANKLKKQVPVPPNVKFAYFFGRICKFVKNKAHGITQILNRFFSQTEFRPPPIGISCSTLSLNYCTLQISCQSFS